MVPDKVDLQNDFVRPDTIQDFAEQFGTFYESGQADGGIMHAAFPSDWMDLQRNEVLESATDIGGTEAPAGAWVQEWHIQNTDLWDLVEDGVLEGYSIGAIDVTFEGPYEQGDVDGVDTSEVDDDEDIWHLADGIIREVSVVDIPAVPDAQILQTKDAYEKRLGDHLGNQSAFVEEAIERGHSEEEAERLWHVLSDAINIEGAGEPGKQSDSIVARAGKAALSVLTGKEADTQSDTQKEGRTLSAQNRDDLKAIIDAGASILQDAGVDHGIERFTDRDDDSFDLSEHSARTFPAPTGTNEPDEPATETDVPPPGTEQSADTDMTDEDTNDPPEWAADIKEQLDEQAERIDELSASDEDKDADADPFEDAPEWAKSLKEDLDKNAERVDNIAKQTGTDSQQLDGAEVSAENEQITERQAFFLPDKDAVRLAAGGN